MSSDKSNGKDVQNHTEAYYEELACEEEIYLEAGEKRARALLISEKSSPFGCKQLSIDRELVEAERSATHASNNPPTAESLNEQRKDAAEELIDGDSDDPPLSEETVVEMLKTSSKS